MGGSLGYRQTFVVVAPSFVFHTNIHNQFT